MGRRSIRKFQPREVPLDLIEQSIQAAIYAPSAKNGKQWRFTVLSGEVKQNFTFFFRKTLDRIFEKEGEQAVGSALHSCKCMEEAPVNIVVWNTMENNC